LSNPLVENKDIVELRAKVHTLEAGLKEAQARIDTLAVIEEIDRSLTSELNLDPLLQKILAGAVKVSSASAGSLLLLDELTDELIFTVVEGGGGENLQGIRIPRSRGIAGWVATHQKPLIVDDVNKDRRYNQSIADTFDIKLTSLLCVPMISHNKVIGVLQVVHTLPGHYFGQSEEELLTAFASKAAICIENARLYESLKEERDKLLVVEDEIRKRLARDLHDGPTQFVAAIVMNLGFIKDLIKKSPKHAPGEIDYTLDLAEKTLKQLRTLLFDLRPVILETQGLIPALDLYTERLRETDELNINLVVTYDFGRLSIRAESAIFAVIQEAVNNAKKHAQASRIDLTLQVDETLDRLIVTVKDNGLGFDVQAMTSGYDKRGSLGMINMQERADAVNGLFKIHSKVGQGTEIELSLPLTENLLDRTKER
jgi:signal transduction histidine kinase